MPNESASSKVIVLILNYNGGEDSLQCLESLRGFGEAMPQTIVIDNGSNDGSLGRISDSLGPGEKIIALPENRGFSGGMNAGLWEGLKRGFVYAFLLNNDTLVERDVIKELMDYMDANKDIGVCGPTIHTLTDAPRNQFPRLEGITAPRDDNALSGAAFMVRMDAVRVVGLLDETFFMYWEDNDYWARMSACHYRVVYVPTKARILHKAGGTAKRVLGPEITYFMLRNEFLFRRRYRAGLGGLAWLTLRAIAGMVASRRGPIVHARALFDGLQLFMLNPPPKWREDQGRVWTEL